MNSAARVRAGDSLREHIEVPTVGFFVWIRFPAPCHTHSGAALKELHMVTQLSKNLPSKTLSPGKRKPTVIFVAVLGPKVHPIKGCFSVFPQPLCCYIWLFALYIGVKLVKPLPGLESGAGAASCCNRCRSRQLGQHKDPVGISAAPQHISPTSCNSKDSIWTTRWGWISTDKAGGTSWCRGHSHWQILSPYANHEYTNFLKKTATRNVFFFSQLFWMK